MASVHQHFHNRRPINYRRLNYTWRAPTVGLPGITSIDVCSCEWFVLWLNLSIIGRLHFKQNGCDKNTFGNSLSGEKHKVTKAVNHDDVIKWKHFPRYWPFVRGIHRSPVNSQHKGQWRGALMFSLICAGINDWVNNREAGDLRRYCAHYYAIIMIMNAVVIGWAYDETGRWRLAKRLDQQVHATKLLLIQQLKIIGQLGGIRFNLDLLKSRFDIGFTSAQTKNYIGPSGPFY